MSEKIRLFLDQPMGEGQSLTLAREQAHYLFGVMRLTVGAVLSVFNGRDGEWRARVAHAGKRAGVLTCEAQSAPQSNPPDVWLCFAPIKKARTDFIVEKAVEMGAARIVPVLTAFTNAERVRVDRLQAHAVEAAEQCGATYVPQVADPVKLERLLADWPDGRQIAFCDERLAGDTAKRQETNTGRASAPWAILIGPEGGFSDPERTRLWALEQAHPIRLGPRILRAETAAVAALVWWQQRYGDWA